VLHFTERTAPLAGFAQVERILLRYVPDYCKSKLDFARYADGVEKAAGRARRLAEHGQEHLVNPSSGVWPLVRKFERG
jgi:hypothetical protein